MEDISQENTAAPSQGTLAACVLHNPLQNITTGAAESDRALLGGTNDVGECLDFTDLAGVGHHSRADK